MVNQAWAIAALLLVLSELILCGTGLSRRAEVQGRFGRMRDAIR